MESPEAFLDEFVRIEVRNIGRSFEVQGDRSRLWVKSIVLLSSLFWPQASYDYGKEFSSFAEACLSYGLRYRTMMAAQTCRTSRISFELAMSGYYHQSQALLRSLAETHKRMLYVRVIPEDVFRFFPTVDIPESVVNLDGYFRKNDPKPSKKQWQHLIDILGKDDRYRHDLDTFRNSNTLIDLTHPHAHPDYLGVDDMMVLDSSTGEQETWSLMPDVQVVKLRYLLMAGAYTTLSVIHETLAWSHTSPGYQDAYEDLLSQIVQLYVAEGRIPSDYRSTADATLWSQ